MKINNTNELTRVCDRIGDAIIAFMRSAEAFHADELRASVIATVGVIAPGSADRVLRDLRQRGLVNYRVLNRRQSLYERVPLAGQLAFAS